MAYSNFKPLIWSKYIEKQLHKLTVFEGDCDYKFEGEAKRGASLKILGVTPPTIKDYVPGKEIDSPETPKDASVYLSINQYKYFSYMIDDIDKAQTNGIMTALSDEAVLEMADIQDAYCAKEMAKGAGVKLPAKKISTPEEMKDYIDSMFVKAWDNSLSKRVLTLYLDPESYNLFEKNLSEIKTDNTRQLTTGTVGMYRNAHVKLTNNIYKEDGNSHIILKSSKGFAFAKGINEVKPFSPEKSFSDAVKGLNTFGGKAVRPKEIICGQVNF